MSETKDTFKNNFELKYLKIFICYLIQKNIVYKKREKILEFIIL